MRMSAIFLLTRLPLLLSINCATFGAEAEDHVLETDSRAQGVALFRVENMPTHEGMSIHGGSDAFHGEMRVTGWFSPGDDHDIFDYLSLSFDHQGDTLAPVTLFHSAEAEHITVREARFDVPRELDVVVDAPDGAVSVADIAGSVAVGSDSGAVSVVDVDDIVLISGAGGVYLENTGPADVQAGGDVSGAIGHGGTIDAGFGDITLSVTDSAFEQLSLTTSRGEVVLRLPFGEGFTLDIDAGYSRGDEDDEEEGHVTIDVGDVYIDRDGVVTEVYEVNGGGPRIVVRDAHKLEIR